MELIRELNEALKILNDISVVYEDLKGLGVNNLLLEVDDHGGTIDWVQPTEKRTITKTPSEEKPHVRTPVAKKGSSVQLSIDNKAYPGIVTDEIDGSLIVSFRQDGRVMRLPPQPRNKFSFVGTGKSGREMFKLDGNFSTNKPVVNKPVTNKPV